MRGGPSNAQNMSTMRPFPGSLRCAIVSAPLPVRSRKATVVASRIANSPLLLFGEQLTWPSALRGADETKKTG